VALSVVVEAVETKCAKRGSPRLESLIARRSRAGQLCAGVQMLLEAGEGMAESDSLHFR
jgi:hypothetical protein